MNDAPMTPTTNMEEAPVNLAQLTADIVSAFVGSSNNSVSAEDLPTLIANVHQSMAALSVSVADEVVEEVRPEPACSIRASIKKDHLVCLEDGKKMKMLKRHLMTDHNLTPDQYRARWGLADDYPMVAPEYSETRRMLAKKIGLGTNLTRSPNATKVKATKKSATKAAAKDAPAKKRGRPSNADKAAAAAAEAEAA